MEIYLNNEKHTREKEVRLSVFLSDMGIDAEKGIAVAVNDTVIPRSEWTNFLLKNSDRITLIKATAGG